MIRGAVIPVLLMLGLAMGLVPVGVRLLLVAVLLLGAGWGLLVTASVGADFAGGLAFGAGNAVVGALLGVGLRTVAQDVFDECARRRGSAR